MALCLEKNAPDLVDVKRFIVSARSLYNETTNSKFFAVPSFEEKKLIAYLATLGCGNAPQDDNAAATLCQNASTSEPENAALPESSSLSDNGRDPARTERFASTTTLV